MVLIFFKGIDFEPPRSGMRDTYSLTVEGRCVEDEVIDDEVIRAEEDRMLNHLLVEVEHFIFLESRAKGNNAKS